MFGIALSAEHWSAFSWLERDFTVLLAISAYSFMLLN